MKKYVASGTLQPPLAWNAELIAGDVAEQVARLKAEDGGNILMYGCGPVARALQEHGLVDEYLFWVYPVVRGAGIRLFGADFSTDLDLVGSRDFAGGFTVLTCVPKR
jgi:dihydrofolate reductase